MTNEMTAEEAVKILRFEQEQIEHRLDGCSDTQENRNIYEAFRMAIKALEQRPFINKPCVSEGVCREDKIQVLDKIRAEIERKAHSGQWSDATMYGMLKAVAVIDKYRAESEDKE